MNRRKRFRMQACVLSVLLVLNACSLRPTLEAPVAAQPSLPDGLMYTCTGGETVREPIEAQYDAINNTATVIFAGQTYVLPLMPSGSGTRYSNGSITWWTKADEALWQMDENFVLRDCRRVHPAQ